LRVLTTQSLDTLKIHLSLNPFAVKKSFDVLISELDLKLIEVDVAENIKESSRLSGSKNQVIDEEIPNVKIIWNCLKDISPLIALDERVWVTLTLSDHRDYLLTRWFDDSGDSDGARRSLDNHLFATSSRRFIRDQALSRLWWAAKISSNLHSIEIERALTVLFWNSDLLSQIIGRPSTSSSSALTSEIILVMGHRKDENLSFNRDKFRAFMSHLDISLGRNLLFSLSPFALKERVAEIAKRTLD
jgi:hypothetical protein